MRFDEQKRKRFPGLKKFFRGDIILSFFDPGKCFVAGLYDNVKDGQKGIDFPPGRA